MRVALDARLESGDRGGVEQVIIGLAAGLSALTDAPDEYLFLVHPEHRDWLAPYLGGSCRTIDAEALPSPAAVAPRRSPPRRAAGKLARVIGYGRPKRPELGPSDPAVDRHGVDLMHFTMQVGFRTSLPSMFMPQDLQHVHLPQFFSRQVLLERDTLYRALADQASVVVANSQFGKRDLEASFGLPPSKVAVVPYAPVIDVYGEPTSAEHEATRAALRLPDAFALYPAKAWLHKNHRRLLDALCILREQGLVIPMVFTGAQNGFDEAVTRSAMELGVADQIHFTGFVKPVQLASIYRTARFMVFPSLFEGWGMPILEAFAAGLPVACSNVTCLPDLAGGAALIFDPLQPRDIAAKMRQLWSGEGLRSDLATRGRARVAQFSWDRTARLVRAHYRVMTNRRLTDEDQVLLAAEPLV
jgi:glycosyltransferase involved in cell wall biosynthesis